MERKLNPIAIWNRKYEDYGNWCYDYRIPDIKEFTYNYEYEIFDKLYKYKSRILSKWDKYKIGEKWSTICTNNELVESNLLSYLICGQIRVKKQNNKMNTKKEVTSIDKVCQKIFYYELAQFKDNKCNGKRKYIILCAFTPKEGYDKIIYPNYVKCLDGDVIKHGSNKLQKELDVNDETGYRISSGGFEITEPITFCDPKDILYYGVDRKDITFKYNKVWSEFIKKVDKQLQNNKKEIFYAKWFTSTIWLNYLEELKKRTNRFGGLRKKIPLKDKRIPRIRINFKKSLNPFSNILDKIEKYFLSPTSIKPIIVEVSKPLNPVNWNTDPNFNIKNYRPISHPKRTQQDKSPNRLVYIATKDKLFVKRLPWHEANDIVKSNSDYLPTINPWQFISKEEGKKLQKPKPQQVLIPSILDRKYKRITVLQEVKGQDTIRNSYRDEETSKMVYLPLTYKYNPEKDYDIWVTKFVEDTSADGKYHPYPKGIQKSSSSKKILYTNHYQPKRSNPNKEQKNKLKQYEVDDETLVNELGGESHSNRTSIFAYSEEEAKNKALKKDVKEGILHVEKGRYGERKYLDRKNAISSLKVKRLDESDTLYQLKRDRSTTVFFMPKIKDLLEPRISINKNQPAINFDSKIGDSIKLGEDKIIKTSTTYEKVVPPKKDKKKIKPKKWRCPINETSEQKYNREKLSKLVNEGKLQELKLRRIPAYTLPNNKSIKIKKKKLIKEIV